MPLPLALIAAWERGVCAPATPAAVKIFLGGLLLAAHASLRFGDLQRIEISQLSLAATALRGTCWTTKTTRQGQPFAVTITGFTGRDISTAWTIHWLTAVATSLTATENTFADHHRPDFALPAFNPSQHQQPPVYATPLAYGQALASIRWAAQTPWLPIPCLTAPEASNITLHSLKVTMLSAALQLRLPEDDRRVQGHHRLNSTRLYGRDDTHQALWVQRRLAEAIAKLWRPQRPMARGGQHPMAEPPFQVPADPPPAGITLAALPPVLERFIYTRESELQTSAPDVTLDKESGSESDSALSEGQSSEGEPLPDPTEEPPGAPGLHPESPEATTPPAPTGTGTDPTTPGSTYHPVQLRSWGCVHAAWLGTHKARPTRTACGLRLDASSIVQGVDLTLAPCRRSACVYARRLIA